MEEQTVDGLECVAIHSYGNSTEIEVIDDEQRNLPFLIRYKGINANYFAYNDRKLLYGNRLPKAPDEVVLSQQFTRKAYGSCNPIGSIIHLSNPKSIPENSIRDFKVVNVVKDNDLRVREADCYFSYEILSNDAISVGGYLSPETDIETLNKNLQSVAWQRDEHTVHPYAYFTMRQDKAWELSLIHI